MTDPTDETTEPTDPVAAPAEPVAPPAAPAPAPTYSRRAAGATAAGALLLGVLLGWLGTKAFDDEGSEERPISFSERGQLPGEPGERMFPGGPEGFPELPEGVYPGIPPWMGHDDDGGHEGYDEGDDQDQGADESTPEGDDRGQRSSESGQDDDGA